MRALLGGLLALASAACNLVDSSEIETNPSSGAGAGAGTGSGAQGGTFAGSTANGPGPSATSTGSGEGGSGVGGGGGAGAGGTPGIIACGPVQCDAMTEVCCPDGASSTCMPSGSICENLSSDLPYGPMSCDDAADCKGGNVCCVQQMGNLLVYNCAPAPCDVHEGCTLGGTCAAGFECVPDPSAPTGARCVDADAAVTCGAATCAAPNGVCCIASTTETCTAFGSDCISTLECDDSADCGAGSVCCGSGGATDLVSTCRAAASCTGVVLCATMADCAGSQTCAPPAASGYPASVQLCQ